MDEDRVLAALGSVKMSMSGRSSTPAEWKPVLVELAEVLEGLTSASPGCVPILDKVFWLVVVTEGISLFSR